jgi:hypothetical protein
MARRAKPLEVLAHGNGHEFGNGHNAATGGGLWGAGSMHGHSDT